MNAADILVGLAALNIIVIGAVAIADFAEKFGWAPWLTERRLRRDAGVARQRREMGLPPVSPAADQGHISVAVWAAFAASVAVVVEAMHN